jgi:S1-C subfamily serine protease
MQFCRSCGFKLFEGFTAQGNYAAAGMARATPMALEKRRTGPHWLVWVIVAVIIASAVGGGLLSRGARNIRRSVAAATAKPTSYLGVDDVESEGGGAMLGVVKPPGGAADKAGLIGGDIVTVIDGHAVTSHEQFSQIMSQMPAGKTIDIGYTRDGVPKTTKLTTMTEEQLDALNEAFDNQPHGLLGVRKWERVPVPGQNIYGVQISRVQDNRAAYFAGLRDGDIIIQMDDKPVRTEEEFVHLTDVAKPQSVVKYVVIRGTERLEIPVTMGVD